MLLRHIRLGAVRRDTHGADTKVICLVQILDCPHAGQDQRGEHAVLEDFGDRCQPFPIGMGTKAVVEARAGEAVGIRIQFLGLTGCPMLRQDKS